MHIEALQARDGDCLLLLWDDKVAVVDGGPAYTYSEALAPRLDELRAERGLQEHEQLLIDLVLVSHIDDDHIGGLVVWTRELAEEAERGHLTTTIRRLWFNSFEDIVGHAIPDRIVTEAREASGLPPHLASRRAVVASVNQGRELRATAERLGLTCNADFEGYPMTAPMPGQPPHIATVGGLHVTVLAPREDSVINLQQAWAHTPLPVREAAATVAAYEDESIYNLSSVACLVEHEWTSGLLSGDALGADILEALNDLDLLNPTLHVTVLKLPHHGSLRSVDTDFFEKITADHYIISGNGRHGNPQLETLDMLVASRPDDDFTLHLTYLYTGSGEYPERIATWIAAQNDSGRRFTIATAISPAPGLTPRIRI